MYQPHATPGFMLTLEAPDERVTLIKVVPAVLRFFLPQTHLARGSGECTKHLKAPLCYQRDRPTSTVPPRTGRTRLSAVMANEYRAANGHMR